VTEKSHHNGMGLDDCSRFVASFSLNESKANLENFIAEPHGPRSDITLLEAFSDLAIMPSLYCA